MPSNLSTPRTDVRRANLQSARESSKLQTLEFRGPYIGYVPDIDHNRLPFTAASTISNLRSRLPVGSAAAGGEALISAPGYVQVDPTRLPLRGLSSNDPAVATPSAVSLGAPVVRIDQLYRTNTVGEVTGDFDVTPLALVTDEHGATAVSGLWRVDPSNGQWVHILNLIAGEALGPGLARDGTGGWTTAMPHTTAYPAGVENDDTGNSQPVMIICTPISNVCFYPTLDTAGGDADRYAYLGKVDFDIADAGVFKAISCATWNGRVYFLNTEEKVGTGTTTTHRQRVRRTVKGDCSDFFGVGSGARDLRDFKQNGLRLEPIGDSMAVYFEDGVAFYNATGNVARPDEFTVITKERGLLATHGMTPIGNNMHFGIYTDGWFVLSADGDFKEVGITEIENTPRYKWKDTFYRALDMNRREQLYCHYDRINRQVHIIVPRLDDPARDTSSTAGIKAPDTQEVWVYDIISDRVYIDHYPAVCFGNIDRQLREALTYANVAGPGIPTGWEGVFQPGGSVPFPDPTPEDMAGFTADSVGPLFAVGDMCHGSNAGLVQVHDSTVVYRASDAAAGTAISYPSFSFESGIRQNATGRNLFTADRMQVEYLTWRPHGVGNSTTTATVFSNTTPAAQSQDLVLDGGSPGDVLTARAWYRLTSPSLGYKLTGISPVAIRAASMDLFVHDDVEMFE